MHAQLTVSENLLYSARFRLPGAATRRQRLLAVERAIVALGLEDVRDGAPWQGGRLQGAGYRGQAWWAPGVLQGLCGPGTGSDLVPWPLRAAPPPAALVGDEEARGIRHGGACCCRGLVGRRARAAGRTAARQPHRRCPLPARPHAAAARRSASMSVWSWWRSHPCCS